MVQTTHSRREIIRSNETQVQRPRPSARAAAGQRWYPSECEIYPSPNHAKVVVWTIHYIPTKIVYPADIRCKANFDATAKFPDCLCLGIARASSRFAKIKRPARWPREPRHCNKMCPFAPTKNAAAAREQVRCKTGARNWITKGQGA